MILFKGIKMQKLFEKYRPKTWAEVVGQSKAVAELDRIKGRGFGGRAFWISGPSGTGKSSIAKLIALDVADDLFIEEIDCSSLTPAKLKDYERTMHLSAWGKGGRCFICNESHGLRRDTIRYFLDLLERLPEKTAVVFTTTTENMGLFEDGLDSHPLLSRRHEIKLTKQGFAPLAAKRVQEIAQAENLDGQPISRYIALANRCKSNMRMMLNQVESGVMAE